MAGGRAAGVERGRGGDGARVNPEEILRRLARLEDQLGPLREVTRLMPVPEEILRRLEALEAQEPENE